MKKLISTAFLLIMISTIQLSAQSKTDKLPEPIVSLCGTIHNNDLVTYADLMKCDELTQPYKELKIKSFSISVLVPNADGKSDGLFIDRVNTGAKLSEESKELIKSLEAKKVKKLLIENVIVFDADGKTERKYHGIVVNIK